MKPEDQTQWDLGASNGAAQDSLMFTSNAELCLDFHHRQQCQINYHRVALGNSTERQVIEPKSPSIKDHPELLRSQEENTKSEPVKSIVKLT